MNLAAALLAPFMLLATAITGDDEAAQDQGRAPGTVGEEPARAFPEQVVPEDAPQWPLGVIRSFEPDSAWQVHIEQRMTIRVAPRASVPVVRDMAAPLPQRARSPRFSERKIGKCLPIGGIVGVEPNGPSNLILFMRDRRMISAQLDRSCRSRAFYSGFYLSRSSDGMVCVDRDTLLSRSGSACKLSRIRQLVEDDD